jgi:hypothetical protein
MYFGRHMLRYEPYVNSDRDVSAYLVSVGFGDVGSVNGGTESMANLAMSKVDNRAHTFQRRRRVQMINSRTIERRSSSEQSCAGPS